MAMNPGMMQEFMEFYEAFQMFQQMKSLAPNLANQTPTIPAAPSINFETNSSSEDVSGQLSALQAEIASLKTQLAEAQREARVNQEHYEQQLKITKQAQETVKSQAGELGGLKQIVKKAEAYLGKSLRDVAAEGEDLSGDDYYDEKKKEWDKEGLSGKEKYEKIKNFKTVFGENENGLIEF